MGREHLPNRRQNETVVVDYQGREVKVCIGYYDDGRPGEVFVDVHQTGTEMQHLLDDACVIISLALQYGVEPGDLTKSLGRVPDLDRGKGADKPASVLGEILEIVSSARSEWPAAVQRLGGEMPQADGPTEPEGGR